MENLDITVEAHIETQQMWNKESKELRDEVEGLKVKLCESDIKRLECIKNLSDLVAAAEPFMTYLEAVGRYNSDGHAIRCYGDAQVLLTVGDLRALSAAVDRVREGK